MIRYLTRRLSAFALPLLVGAFTAIACSDGIRRWRDDGFDGGDAGDGPGKIPDANPFMRDANNMSDANGIPDANHFPDANGFPDANNVPDGSDGSFGSDGGSDGSDHYMDAGDGGNRNTIFTRPGINDRFAPLPFCARRNIFTLQGEEAIGFCNDKPTTLYSFLLSSDLSSVSPQTRLTLPERIGGREVIPINIRNATPHKVLLPMMSPNADTAATFLLIDVAARAFIPQQVDATGLQIGRFPQGDPIPISGLSDMIFVGSEFWGVLANPNEDGTHRFGFGIVLPQTADWLVDTGVPDNSNVILSNRFVGFVSEVLDAGVPEPGNHFSFRTTHKKPTVLADLGSGRVAIQNNGVTSDPDNPASIDVADSTTHQILLRPDGTTPYNIRLGNIPLVTLPVLTANTGAMKVYPATATSLWEVDVSETAPQEQQNEIPLAGSLRGSIAAVVLRGGEVVVGDSGGQLLFVGLSGENHGRVTRSVEVGHDLTHMVSDESGRLFVAVGATVESDEPHVIAIDPDQLE